MKLLVPLLTLALAACGITQYARWPYRGPMFMVTNPTNARLVVLARDGMGRELVTATIKAKGRECFRWPFIHQIGFLIAAGPDTLRTHSFEPWTADGWEWSATLEPVANPRACR